jgi:hypothetical protein
VSKDVLHRRLLLMYYLLHCDTLMQAEGRDIFCTTGTAPLLPCGVEQADREGEQQRSRDPAHTRYRYTTVSTETASFDSRLHWQSVLNLE